MRQASRVLDLDAYREEADGFLAALDEEYYRHFAGLKDAFELGPIYERYSDLTTLDACDRLAAVAGESSGSGVRELWRFACEGYLGELTVTDDEELANLEAASSVEVDGEVIGYRMLKPAIGNEPGRGRRERLELAREALARERFDPIYRRAAGLKLRQAGSDRGQIEGAAELAAHFQGDSARQDHRQERDLRRTLQHQSRRRLNQIGRAHV